MADQKTDDDQGRSGNPNMAVQRDARPVVERTAGHSTPNDESAGKNQPQDRLK